MEPEHPQVAETAVDVLAMPAEPHDVQLHFGEGQDIGQLV